MVKENEEPKNKIKTVSNNCASLQQKAVDLENKLEASKAQKLSLEVKVNELSLKHDDLEQYTRKFNLEIYGIPEESEEDTEQIILGFAKCLNVDLAPEDVDISDRVKKGNIQPRPIIVRFSNYNSKERTYHNRGKQFTTIVSKRSGVFARRRKSVHKRKFDGSKGKFIQESAT